MHFLDFFSVVDALVFYIFFCSQSSPASYWMCSRFTIVPDQSQFPAENVSVSVHLKLCQPLSESSLFRMILKFFLFGKDQMATD